MRKPSLLLCLAPALVLILPGCAANPDKKPSVEYDNDYVSRVEDRARHSGLEVIWINPPYKRVEEDDG